MKEKKIDWPYLGQLALVTCAQLVLLWVLLGYFVRWGFLFGQALSRTQMQLWAFGWGAGFTLLSLHFKTRDSLAFLAVLTDSIITALLAYWVYFLTSRLWYFLLFSLAAVAAAAAIYIASLRQMRRISRQRKLPGISRSTRTVLPEAMRALAAAATAAGAQAPS